MAIQREYPNVHWVWEGGISFVYEVDPQIVVKVPQPSEFEKEQFKKELQIYKTFSQRLPCPSIVQCFYTTDNGIFLEYMRDVTLCYRLQQNHIRDAKTMVVTQVHKLEPLPLRKQWMNELAQAVAFLESLNLAHGDLRPDNILLDRDRLRLSDFDCTDQIGTYFEACIAPYGRLINVDETDKGESGGAGYLGPRTEQFALGSIYYYINYGFEVYGDRCLAPENPREHGPKTVDLLRYMEFPELNGDPVFDEIIDRCWHNKYARVADLAAHVQTLLDADEPFGETEGCGECNGDEHGGSGEKKIGDEDSTDEGGAECHRDERDGADEEEQLGEEDGEAKGDGEDLSSKQALCRSLEERGLLDILSSAEPKELGFKLEWYRQSQSLTGKA